MFLTGNHNVVLTDSGWDTSYRTSSSSSSSTEAMGIILFLLLINIIIILIISNNKGGKTKIKSYEPKVGDIDQLLKYLNIKMIKI